MTNLKKKPWDGKTMVKYDTENSGNADITRNAAPNAASLDAPNLNTVPPDDITVPTEDKLVIYLYIKTKLVVRRNLKL